MKDRIVITGGGGMLARALAVALSARGKSPIALTRAELDVADDKSLQQMFEKCRPTLLFNCAAYTKVDACEDEKEKCTAINGHAVGSMATFCREFKTTLVHFSTDFVFDGKSTRPYRVDDPTNPISEYGKSKLLGEWMLECKPPKRWMIIRTAWVYGPGGMNFPRVIVEKARQGQPLKVVNDEVGSPTFTDDLAQATLELLDREANGVWHVTNSGAVSRYDYAKAILEEFDLKTDLTPITTAEWFKIRPKQAIRPVYSVLDIEPFAQKVGRSMRPWREGLHAFKQAVDARGSF